MYPLPSNFPTLGRDSVLAQQRPHDLQVENKLMNREELDADLERRLISQFTLEKAPYDIPTLNAAFQTKDKYKKGHLKRVEASAKNTYNLVRDDFPNIYNAILC